MIHIKERKELLPQWLDAFLKVSSIDILKENLTKTGKVRYQKCLYDAAGCDVVTLKYNQGKSEVNVFMNKEALLHAANRIGFNFKNVI